MKLGKKPKMLQVGTIDIHGKQELKTVMTGEVYKYITKLNSENNLVTLVISKPVKQVEAFDGKES